VSFRGACHCGNVKLELDWRGDPHAIPARACQCSFCLRHGAVWTAHPGSVLEVFIRDADLVSPYAFGTATATFHVCRRCGVVPAVTSLIDEKLFAVVNVNVLEGVDPAALQHATVDLEGEDAETRLARRARGWIGTVRGFGG